MIQNRVPDSESFEAGEMTRPGKGGQVGVVETAVANFQSRRVSEMGARSKLLGPATHGTHDQRTQRRSLAPFRTTLSKGFCGCRALFWKTPPEPDILDHASEGLGHPAFLMLAEQYILAIPAGLTSGRLPVGSGKTALEANELGSVVVVVGLIQ